MHPSAIQSVAEIPYHNLDPAQECNLWKDVHWRWVSFNAAMQHFLSGAPCDTVFSHSPNLTLTPVRVDLDTVRRRNDDVELSGSLSALPNLSQPTNQPVSISSVASGSWVALQGYSCFLQCYLRLLCTVNLNFRLLKIQSPTSRSS